jgi:phosphate transport system protein
VDELGHQIYREPLTYTEDSQTIPRATRFLLISKYLERIADHATNIAEMVVFMVQGRTIRHMDMRREAS